MTASPAVRVHALALGPASLVLAATTALASPLAFEPNRGQTDARVAYVSRGKGFALFLARDEAVLSLGDGRAPLRVRLPGAPAKAIEGEGPLPGVSHYFRGSDPARWVLDVPSYERVRYRGIDPGIDLVFYGRDGELEYDFEIAAGRDHRRLELRFDGGGVLRLDAEGNLLLGSGESELRWRRPVAYEVALGERRRVECRYVLEGRNRVAFEVGRRDPALPLVIDPTLASSTYLGGSASDFANAIAVDAAGNAYLTGQTASTDYPGTGTHQGPLDAFVTKLDPSGATRLYSAYLGGGGSDIGYAIAVDASGSVIVGGETDSVNFPTTAGAFQAVKGMGRDGFVTKLGPTGAIVYSTFLGGTGADQGDRVNGVALDSSGNVVVVGRTDSPDFPVTAGVLFPFFRGLDFDAFVTKLNPAASGAAGLVYSTFLGGQANDAAFSVALDSSGNVHVVGGADSIDFPTSASAYQGSNTAGSTDAFYTKLDANASAVLYSTFLGGSSRNERANGVALDASGRAVVVGQTPSSDFPLKNALQTYQGSTDAFVAKIDSTLSGDASLLFSSYLGGTGDDTARAVAVDGAGRIYVTGQTTSSTTFPIVNAVQPVFGGGPTDAFVTKLSADGGTRLYSTFLGGGDVEGRTAAELGGHGIAAAVCGDAWVAGRTVSTNFPTVNPAQPDAGGLGDAFAVRIADPDPPTLSGVVPPWGPLAGGTAVTIVGTCLRPGATATFGGTPANGVTVARSTLMNAITPAHAAGPVPVTVTNPGPMAVTLPNAFTYGATGFFTLPPCRAVDTRVTPGPAGGPALAANTERTFTLAGQCGIPANAGAVSANVTVTQSTAAGDLRLFPGGTLLPLVSSLNYGAAGTRANNQTLLLGPGGTLSVRCVQPSGSVHFILDVNGYYR